MNTPVPEARAKLDPAAIVVFPLSEIAPVPVLNVVAPVWEKLPAVVTLPVKVDAPSTVRVPLAWIFPVLEIVTPVEP